MIELGILLALCCALASNVAFLCKHRGAVAAPAVSMRHPLTSAAGLFRSRWWTIGFAAAAAAWLFHVAALAVAPLSMVQVVISAGLVLLVFPAERWFGFKLGRREWTGLAMCGLGLALLAITTDPAAVRDHASYSVPAMISFEAGMIGIGVALLASGGIERVRGLHGELLGIAAGILLGVANVAIKALTSTVPSDVLALISPWTGVVLVAGVLSFFALARGLQTGDGISVIALSSVAGNCAAILGGILVFGDPIGEDVLGVIARSAAFVTVIAAAAMIPGPLRAARARA